MAVRQGTAMFHKIGNRKETCLFTIAHFETKRSARVLFRVGILIVVVGERTLISSTMCQGPHIEDLSTLHLQGVLSRLNRHLGVLHERRVD
jgi:hypothetical protein